MANDVSLTVGGGAPIRDPAAVAGSSSSRVRPDYPLPPTPTRASSTAVDANASRMATTSADPIYKGIGEAITRQLTGFSPKEIKKGFQESWQKDKKHGNILRGLKMAGRCVGFAAGSLINVTGRLAAFTFGAGISLTAGVLQFIFTPKKSFKEPAKIMENIVGFGAIGIGGGAGISWIGMKLSKCTTGIKFEEGSDGKRPSTFERSAMDSAIPGLVGVAIGAGVCCLYPAMWQKSVFEDTPQAFTDALQGTQSRGADQTPGVDDRAFIDDESSIDDDDDYFAPGVDVGRTDQPDGIRTDDDILQ